MSGVNKFSGKGQGKINHVIFQRKMTSLLNEKLLSPKNVTTSEEVDKGIKRLDDKK